MDIKQFVQLLKTKLPQNIIFENEQMKNYTTFKIGGNVDVMIKPTSYEEVSEAIKLCRAHKIPYYILGNGSNLLVADEGYRGVVIQIYNQLANVQVEENMIKAQAGALLSKIAHKAMENSLTGLEFAHGIPGTLGGAVVMNAGAYDGEMKNVLVSCDVLDEEGNIVTLTNEALELGYRTSIIQKKNYVVLGATMVLKQGNQEAIKDYMKELMGRRKDKQPLDKPSAGSTFKRPEGHFAGKLIMDSGLRGYQIGGAMVSEKHCGFVVNAGGATCKDVEQLIEHVQKVVYEKFNVQLEAEVKFLK
ncbi:MAG: UDP-N-acetylmuramate dehydrogenase [Cellulosilyticum sp.]|nr:UDP-N-acetylmuramate dehydrogenase [Cellulosilyticum sp.]MEE1071035.1 UDP-N-acetylmuramate dehydrogenase [Cellulosilyticum sp.]